MQKKQRILFCLVSLTLLLFTTQKVNAQCNPANTNLNFTLENTQISECSDGIIKITLNAGSIAATGYTAITVNVTGPQDHGPHKLEGSTYEVTHLAPGTYNVSLTGYCTENIENEADKGETITNSILVKGSYVPLEVGATVTKKPLFDCSETGEVEFIYAANKGKTPFSIKVLSGPSRVGDEITVGETDRKFKINGLKAGKYVFETSDRCSSLEKEVTLESITDFGISGGTFVPIKKDNQECKTADIQSISVPVDLGKHVQKAGSQDDTGAITYRVYYADDEAGTTNPVDCDFNYTFNGTYLTFNVTNIPGGYSTLRGKYFILEVTIKDICDLSATQTYRKTYFVNDTGFKDSFKSEISSQNCGEPVLYVPATSTMNYNLNHFICTPIHYTITKEGESTPRKEADFYWANGQARYDDLEEGTYTINYADNSGATWSETITLKNNHLLNEDSGLKFTLDEYGRKYTMIDCIDSNSDDCHYTYAAFENMNKSAIGFDLTYDVVPAGFYYSAGTTISVTENMIGQNNKLVINSLWKTENNNSVVCRLVPGDYKVTLSDPSCTETKKRSFEITAYQTSLTDLEYDITYSCGKALVRIKPGIKLSYNNVTYTNETTHKVLFAVEACVSDPYVSLDKTYKYAAGSDDASNYIELPVSGRYFLTFSSTETGAKVGTTSAGHYNVAVRYIDVNILPFQFSEKDTRAYMCPGAQTGTTVTARTVNGSGTTTYDLFQKEENGDFTKKATQTGSAGDLIIFNLSDGKAGTEYRIEAIDGCNSRIYKGVISTALNNKVYVAGQLTGCPGDNITLKATYIPAATYEWEFKKKGETSYIALTGSTNEYSISGFDENTHGGHYKVTFKIAGCTDIEAESEVKAAPLTVVWTPENNTDEASRASWDNENNWTPVGIPATCTDVYIPGNSIVFPELTEDSGNTCDNIYFLPGAQVGQIQYLTYTEARVQVDLGEGSRAQSKTSDAGVFANIGKTNNDLINWNDRSEFGAGKSNSSLTRNRWYMLTSPLHGVWTGDLAFGGYPFTYVRKFATNENSEGGSSFLQGSWTNFYSSMIEEFNPAEGFAYWVNEYKDARRYHDTRDQFPKDGLGGNTVFGLAELNGILELPYFKEDEISKRHRNHEYTANSSTFHYFWQSPTSADYFLDFVEGDTETKERSANSYRFIGEDENQKMKDVLSLNLESNNGNIFLVGNPYMSALDFDKFYEDNKEVIKPGYKLFSGENFDDYTIEESVDTKKIAPMQAFFVESKENSVDVYLKYIPANISTTDNSADNQIRSSFNSYSNNVLNITLSNENGNTITKIRQLENAKDTFCDWDFSKIIESPLQTLLPEVYSITEWENKPKAVSINSIYSNDLDIPLGIATAYSGNLTFELTGMDNYSADIIFSDLYKNEHVDITGKDVFSYDFVYETSFSEDGKSALPQEDRFMISLSPKGNIIDEVKNYSITAKVADNSVVIISSSTTDTIESVLVYDIQGRLLSKENQLHSSYHKTPSVLKQNGVYLVKVRTSNGYIETLKLIK